MLKQYVQTYGDSILTGQEVEAEIVEDTEKTGQASEGNGLDAQAQALQSETLFEDQDEDE